MNMNDDTITINLNDVESTEFSWNNSTTSIAMQASSITGPSTVTMNNVVSNNIVTIGSAIPASGGYTISTSYDDMEERLSKLEKIIAHEEEVRRTHPAVQMAYDEYRLLYVLAKKNSGDLLTD